MSDNIAKLIHDIDKLDGHRRNMMEELKVFRDITLFYHERHPELRGTGPLKRHAKDDNEGPTRQHDTPEVYNQTGQTKDENAGEPETKDGETPEHT